MLWPNRRVASKNEMDLLREQVWQRGGWKTKIIFTWRKMEDWDGSCILLCNESRSDYCLRFLLIWFTEVHKHLIKQDPKTFLG